MAVALSIFSFFSDGTLHHCEVSKFEKRLCQVSQISRPKPRTADLVADGITVYCYALKTIWLRTCQSKTLKHKNIQTVESCSESVTANLFAT